MLYGRIPPDKKGFPAAWAFDELDGTLGDIVVDRLHPLLVNNQYQQRSRHQPCQNRDSSVGSSHPSLCNQHTAQPKRTSTSASSVIGLAGSSSSIR
jgi:hypothetical protein